MKTFPRKLWGGMGNVTKHRSKVVFEGNRCRGGKSKKKGRGKEYKTRKSHAIWGEKKKHICVNVVGGDQTTTKEE